jgi:hypothetical protein
MDLRYQLAHLCMTQFAPSINPLLITISYHPLQITLVAIDGIYRQPPLMAQMLQKCLIMSLGAGFHDACAQLGSKTV